MKFTLDILELQIKSKKKSNLFEGGHLQKSLGNPALEEQEFFFAGNNVKKRYSKIKTLYIRANVQLNKHEIGE